MYIHCWALLICKLNKQVQDVFTENRGFWVKKAMSYWQCNKTMLFLLTEINTIKIVLVIENAEKKFDINIT